MAKTAVVKARVDAAMLVALDEVVAASVGDRSDHVRKAVEEYVRIRREQAQMAVADAHNPQLSAPRGACPETGANGAGMGGDDE